MRRLYEEFGKTGIGYTEADYQRIVSEVAGRDMQAYFDKFIYGLEPLAGALDKVLRTVGCQLATVDNASEAERVFGLRVQARADRTNVVYCWPGSPAEAVLRVDDEIVAVDGVREIPNALLLLTSQSPTYELTILRQNKLRTVRLTAEPGRTFGPYYGVRKLSEADETQRAGFAKWLGWEF